MLNHLLLDADVLIDYLKANLSVLALASRHIGKAHVLSTVLQYEVDGLDAEDCEQRGIEVVEPDLEQLSEASLLHGSLSFNDYLCLIIASRRGFVCVTNDKALRKACERDGVSTLWGLEVMLELVRNQAMKVEDAIQIAEMISKNNPYHVPEKLVVQFSQSARSAGRQDASDLPIVNLLMII